MGIDEEAFRQTYDAVAAALGVTQPLRESSNGSMVFMPYNLHHGAGRAQYFENALMVGCLGIDDQEPSFPFLVVNPEGQVLFNSYDYGTDDSPQKPALPGSRNDGIEAAPWAENYSAGADASGLVEELRERLAEEVLQEGTDLLVQIQVPYQGNPAHGPGAMVNIAMGVRVQPGRLEERRVPHLLMQLTQAMYPTVEGLHRGEIPVNAGPPPEM